MSLRQRIDLTRFRLQFLSLGRLLTIVGISGVFNPSYADFVMLIFGLGCAYLVTPYFGWNLLSLKEHDDPKEFVSLPKWAVSNASSEITKDEYEEIVNDRLSVLGREKLNEIKVGERITYLDIMNLALFEQTTAAFYESIL